MVKQQSILAAGLVERGVKILGTSLEDLDRAEDRDKFEHALNRTENSNA